jgi:hypothetical protein
MSDAPYEIWCFLELEGSALPFPVLASSTISIGQLKIIIKRELNNALQHVDAYNLILWKVCYF